MAKATKNCAAPVQGLLDFLLYNFVSRHFILSRNVIGDQLGESCYYTF